MVFGTIDLSEKSSGYKVHPIDEENTLWSKLFYARKDDVMVAGSRKAALGSNFSARWVCQIFQILLYILRRQLVMEVL